MAMDRNFDVPPGRLQGLPLAILVVVPLWLLIGAGIFAALSGCATPLYETEMEN